MSAADDAMRVARGIREAGRAAESIALGGLQAAAEEARRAAAGDSPVDTGALRRSWRVVRRGRVVSLVNDRPRSAFVLGGEVAAEAIELTQRAVDKAAPTIQRALVDKARG